MKKIALIALCFLSYVNGRAQSVKENSADGLVAQLKTYTAKHLTEKTYLQFDKPYYAAGDTIYFKAYVAAGERHELSNISGVLHVDIINTKNKVDQAIKLQLIEGVAWGDFALPDSLPKGTYRVRAWTQWMRNDPGSFFEKEIPIGSITDTKVSESTTARIKAVQPKADLQFFPEGGEMITGLDNRIAFKATGINGLAMAVKGRVIDNDNKEVLSFNSAHLGMGSFALTPETGKSYKAQVTYADGSKDEIPLPTANNKGIILSVNNDSIPKATVKIQANKAFFLENKNKEYTLLIYSGGVATTVAWKLDSTSISMDIKKRKLFTGIATVTLFSQDNEPLAERLIFIQNYDQLNLAVNPDKDTYHTRDKVSIKLTAKTRTDSTVMGHFSVSVTDESKVKPDEDNETTILSSLLLTSDLKGYVERPNYYFTSTNADINETKLKELDLVMLTHGYRKFTWQQLNSKDTIKYQPEQGLEINGRVLNVLGKPVVKGTISLISLEKRRFISDTTNSQGYFSFRDLAFTDTTRFMLQAVNAKGKNSAKLIYNQDKPGPPVSNFIVSTDQQDINQTMQGYLENTEKQQEELNRLGLGKGRQLKEIKIKALVHPNIKSESLVSTAFANQVIYSDDIPYAGRLSAKLMGLVHRLKWTQDPDDPSSFIPAGQVLIVVDGMEMHRYSRILSQISPESVAMVEVLLPPTSYVYGPDAYGGALIITTKPGGVDPKNLPSTGVLPILAKGYHKARGFYTPKYEHADDNPDRKDLRSTIYWQPEILTDKEGNASLQYYTADGTGDYRVTIEGIDEKGNIGRKVFTYKVQ